MTDPGQVKSQQTQPHRRLQQILQRHLQTNWNQPFHQPTVVAYQRLLNSRALDDDRPLILDSGCGTGYSTQKFAVMFPDHLVIGADRSGVRLLKGGVSDGFLSVGNCILLRAELTTLWRLLLRDRHLPDRHYLFYPNPWPKAAHLRRRWHGHPVFPQLLALGGEIEMRCNWLVYAHEFAQAVSFVTGQRIVVSDCLPVSASSLYEKKYQARNQPLYVVVVPQKATETFRQRVNTIKCQNTGV